MSTTIDKDSVRAAFDDVRDDTSPTTWYIGLRLLLRMLVKQLACIGLLQTVRNVRWPRPVLPLVSRFQYTQSDGTERQTSD